MTQEVFTMKEAAAFLRVHRATFARMRIPFSYVGKRKRYRRADLEAALQRKPRGQAA